VHRKVGATGDKLMLSDSFGPPQLAALLILLQRGAEELHSQRNTRRLLQQGAREAGREYYPVVAATHLGWIAALAFLIPPHAPVQMPALMAFLALQPLRYWIIGTLGRYWTHRIITLPGAPIVTRGPYRFIRHPNYAVTLAETLLLPLAFGQLWLGIIFAAVWAAVLNYKVHLEDAALAARRAEKDAGP
jgi:methyltransferase